MSLKQAVYRPNGRVVVRTIGDDTLLVPVSGPASGGRVFPVNESALTVWSCLSEGGSFGAAVEQFVARYGLDEREAEEDVQACVETLLSEELLTPAE
ncbi:MAG TPA: PqqD family protein [Tichowtungia sp.]|nr:PqqD family protein [Tichowtungia sp.]